MEPRKTLYETLTLYLVAASTLLLDQFVKFGIVAAIALGNSRPLIDGFLNLTYVRNYGAAFSMFWGHGDKLSLVAGVIAIAVVVYQWRSRPRELPMVLALGFLLGGSLGNLVDRVYLGYVRDMFDLRWHGQNIWPIFNVADMAVLAAAGLLIAHSMSQDRRLKSPQA